MIKIIIPTIIIFLIVLFLEKINEKIYEKFKVKINYVALFGILIILGIIGILLYF